MAIEVGVKIAPADTAAAPVLLCVNAKLLAVCWAVACEAFKVLDAAVAAVAVELELALVDCVLDDWELCCSSLTGVVSGSEGRLSAACDLRVNKIAVLKKY